MVPAYDSLPYFFEECEDAADVVVSGSLHEHRAIADFSLLKLAQGFGHGAIFQVALVAHEEQRERAVLVRLVQARKPLIQVVEALLRVYRVDEDGHWTSRKNKGAKFWTSPSPAVFQMFSLMRKRLPPSVTLKMRQKSKTLIDWSVCYSVGLPSINVLMMLVLPTPG